MVDVFIAARNPRTPIINPPNECTPPGAPNPNRFRSKQSTPKALTPSKTHDGSLSTVENLVHGIDGLGISGVGDHHLAFVGSFPLLLIINQKTNILIDRIHILCEKSAGNITNGANRIPLNRFGIY